MGLTVLWSIRARLTTGLLTTDGWDYSFYGSLVRGLPQWTGLTVLWSIGARLTTVGRDNHSVKNWAYLTTGLLTTYVEVDAVPDTMFAKLGGWRVVAIPETYSEHLLQYNQA